MDSQDVNAANILIALKRNRFLDLKYSSDYQTACNQSNSLKEQDSLNLFNQNCDSKNTNFSYSHSYSQKLPDLINSIDDNLSRQKKPQKRRIQNNKFYNSYDKIEHNNYWDNFSYADCELANQQGKKNQIFNVEFFNRTISNQSENCLICEKLSISNQQSHSKQFNYSEYIANKNAIDYSDVNDSSNKVNESNFSESDFNFYYSEQNLYSSYNEKYFDNKTKYRIFVERYGNNIRVFKPMFIVRGTNTLLCSIIGTYCDCNGKNSNLKPPSDFIWPIDANRHDENVTTIRKLIRDNPVDDMLPYVEEKNEIKPFSLEFNNFEDCHSKINSNFNKLNYFNVIIDNYETYLTKTNESGPKRLGNDLCKNSNNIKLKKSKNFRNVKPAHCPFCFRRFSSNSAAKMHYNGRPTKNYERGHISCKVASTISGSGNSEPILCEKNCQICS